LLEEVVIFLDRRFTLEDLDRALAGAGAVVVEDGVARVSAGESFMDFYLAEDLRSSYAPDELDEIERHVPGSRPVLALYRSMADARAVMSRLADAVPADLLVDDGAASLSLRTLENWTATAPPQRPRP
jgi:hypothetical protein